MTHTHPEAIEYELAAAELERAAAPAPEECDHDYELVDDSFDHEFGTEQIVYRRCKTCGHEAEADPPSADDYL